MENFFTLKIITPEKTVFDGKAVSLVAPCAFGYLGVLAHHAPLVANVVKGKITVRKETGESLTFTSGGKGFLEVLKDNVTLFLQSFDTPA
jgi:F-type H+-transporting ATPase subunit epsilon